MYCIAGVLKWFFVLFIISNFSTLAYSKQTIHNNYKLNLTFILVPETVACGQQGYSDHKAVPKKSCKTTLTKPQTDYWIDYDIYIYQKNKVPPQTIKLHTALLNEILEYFKEFKGNRLTPNEGMSIVLIFGLVMDQQKEVSLKLTRSKACIKDGNDNIICIDPYEKDYILPINEHWINHQRADVFLPGFNVKWDLFIDNVKYFTIKTK